MSILFNGERTGFSAKGVWENGIYIGQKKKLNPYLTPYTKITQNELKI